MMNYAAILVSAFLLAQVPVHVVKPALETAPVANDPDDPAIWISAANPSRSLILGTDKEEEKGGLYVFDLDGTVRQVIAPMDRPNNVDVEYDFRLGNDTIDIAVFTERMRKRLRVFAIPPDGGALRDLAPAGLPVLEGQMAKPASRWAWRCIVGRVTVPYSRSCLRKTAGRRTTSGSIA